MDVHLAELTANRDVRMSLRVSDRLRVQTPSADSWAHVLALREYDRGRWGR